MSIGINEQLTQDSTSNNTLVEIADGADSGNKLIINSDGSLDSRLYDSSGNGITSQLNGSQRALDVGIDVSGTQVDPRQIGITTTVIPSPHSNLSILNPALDEYGRIIESDISYISTYWGTQFYFTTNTQVLTGTTETNYILILNPTGSGKTVKFNRMRFNSNITNNDTTTYRLYKNPTITTNGTLITNIIGAKTTGQNSNVTNFYSVPTTSNNGTLFRIVIVVQGGASEVDNYDFSLWLESGQSILITRELSTNATIGGINVVWAEQ